MRRYTQGITINSTLLDEWDYEKNAGVDPENLTHGSGKKVWWKCTKNDHHIWVARVADRSSGKGCPYCTNQKICPCKQHCNSLAYIDPKLAKEWHIDNKLKPSQVVCASNKTVKWICDKSVCGCHSWIAIIANRSSGTGCPYCANRKICPCKQQCNSLEYKRPKLVKEWHPDNKLKPAQVVPSSNKKAKWICPKSACRCHIWIATVFDRNSGTGCPYCSNLKICPCGDHCNSLAHINPKLTKEWHPDNKLTPSQVSPSCGKRIKWICDKSACGEHTWMTTIAHRTSGSKCPFCANQKICPCKQHCNSLAFKNQVLVGEWHPDNKLKPSQVTPSSNKIVKWRCDKSTHGYHIWMASINNRTAGEGCPICRESKGEKAISESLANINCSFQSQKRQPMSINNYKRTLIFDFYGTHKDINFVIEFDGHQHFNSDSYYSKKGNFADSQLKDWLKTRWCSENNIKLFRIHYSDINKIQQIVTKYITNIETVAMIELSSNPDGDYDFMTSDDPPT